jgi:hypothetical protein
MHVVNVFGLRTVPDLVLVMISDLQGRRGRSAGVARGTEKGGSGEGGEGERGEEVERERKGREGERGRRERASEKRETDQKVLYLELGVHT